MNFRELLQQYFDSRKMIDDVWVLDDAKYLEDLVRACGKNFDAKSFLFMGGEAIVILVQDTYLNINRILKIPRPDLPEVAQKRFVRSARTLANLKNGYFPRVLYLSVNPFFLLLDWTIGETLRDWAFSQRYSIDAGINFFREILIGMDLIHQDGVVHRDIRPDNILICKNGHIKILDFGLAKTGESRRLTTIAALGNNAYSPPEQLTHAGDVDHASADVYSLAQTFFFVATKREKTKKEEMLPPELLLSSGLKPAICGWYSRATETDAKARYQNAKEMLTEFNKIFPPPLPMVATREEDLYSLAEDLELLLEGDLYMGSIFTSHFLTGAQLARLWRAVSERRALQCISE